MKIISTNIAEPKTILWQGREILTGIYKFEVNTPIFLDFEDVVNDHVLDRRYHGGKDKACYLYSADHYPFWKLNYPNKDWQWGMFGENLTVSGLNESEIKIGDIFKIGDSIVQVSQPRQPCFKLGIRFDDQAIVDEFWKSPYPGIYVRIIEPGAVKKDDEFRLINRNPESLTICEVFSIFRSKKYNAELIQKAIEDPFLADSCKKDLKKLLK